MADQSVGPITQLPRDVEYTCKSLELLGGKEFSEYQVGWVNQYTATILLAAGYQMAGATKNLVPESTPGEIPIVLPRLEQLQTIYKSLSTLHKMHMKINVEDCVSAFLWVFVHYGVDFASRYMDYLASPDSGTIIHSNIKNATSDLERRIQLLPPSKVTVVEPDRADDDPISPFTVSDVQITAHFILISLNKSFVGDTSQYAEWYAKRFKAIRNGRLLIGDEGIKMISALFSRLPKLKQTLFFMALNSATRHHELSSALVFMRNSQMTTINMMIDFINFSPITKAHVRADVLGDLKRLLGEVKRWKDIVGKLWPYIRFIHPNLPDFELNRFPHLATATYEWCKEYGPRSMESYKLEVQGAHAGISQDIAVEIAFKGGSTYSQDEIDLAREFGYDLNKLKTAESESPTMETLKELIASMRLPQA